MEFFCIMYNSVNLCVSGYIMRAFLLLVFLLSLNLSYEQQKQCGCKTDTLINQFTVDCKTILLNNGSKLFWQFNCDSIWLTLQNQLGKKIIIDTVPIEYYPYAYRLGYHLMKEYQNTLLFRSGCSADGPCNFNLIDKNNGEKLKQFGELIYDHSNEKFYDFIIYFSSKNILTLYFIDKDQKYNVQIDGANFNSIVPEYQFDKINLEDKILTLIYHYEIQNRRVQKQIIIDLKKYIQ